MTQEVRPIGGDFDVETDVRERHRLEERRPRRGFGHDGHDALVVRTQLELAWRAKHPVRRDAADLARREFEAAGQHGPDRRVGVLGAGHHIRGTTDDFHDALAVVHLAQREPIGIRMPLRLFDEPDDHTVERRRDPFDTLDRRPQHGEPPSRVIGVDGASEQRREPVHGDVHRYSTNCDRKRMSFSNRVRMSGMPCRSIVIRSNPIPKA